LPFSAKILSTNSNYAHQITAHPFHQLPMGVGDGNSRSFEVCSGFGGLAGLDVNGMPRPHSWNWWIYSCQTFPKILSNNSNYAHQITAHPFHHLPVGAGDGNEGPLRFVLALEVLGWMWMGSQELKAKTDGSIVFILPYESNKQHCMDKEEFHWVCGVMRGWFSAKLGSKISDGSQLMSAHFLLPPTATGT
jgi:hypothetical protein